jgi:import receptor subunit TOM70
LCRKAIEVDPLCDIAYTQLAQLLCLSNKLDEAVGVYDKAIGIARTEVELVNVLSCQEAALAQAYVVRTFPEVMNNAD